MYNFVRATTNCDFHILISQVLIYLPCHPRQEQHRHQHHLKGREGRWMVSVDGLTSRVRGEANRTAKLVLFVQIWINGRRLF